MNFTFISFRNNQTIQSIRTHKIRLFLQKARLINWLELNLVVYLKVSYGMYKDNFGNISIFYNDGIYKNKNDFWLAFKAFTD